MVWWVEVTHLLWDGTVEMWVWGEMSVSVVARLKARRLP